MEYPVPPVCIVMFCRTPACPNVAVASPSDTTPPPLRATVGAIVYKFPLFVNVNSFNAPVLPRVAVAVAIWNGLVVTSTGCAPPVYPDPSPVKFTVPKPFLRTTNDLVEKLAASDDPNTVDPPNPAIFRAP